MLKLSCTYMPQDHSAVDSTLFIIQLQFNNGKYIYIHLMQYIWLLKHQQYQGPRQLRSKNQYRSERAFDKFQAPRVFHRFSLFREITLRAPPRPYFLQCLISGPPCQLFVSHQNLVFIWRPEQQLLICLILVTASFGGRMRKERRERKKHELCI